MYEFLPANEAVQYKNIRSNFYYKNQPQIYIPKNPIGYDNMIIMLSPNKEATMTSINAQYIPWTKFQVKYLTTDMLYHQKIGSKTIHKNMMNELKTFYPNENKTTVRFRMPTVLAHEIAANKSFIYDFGIWNDLYFTYKYKRNLQITCRQYLEFLVNKLTSIIPNQGYSNKILYFSYAEWRKRGATIGIAQNCLNNPLSIILTCIYRYQALLKPLVDLGVDLLVVNEEAHEFIKIKLDSNVTEPQSAKSIYNKLKTQLKRMSVVAIATSKETETEVKEIEKISPEEKILRAQLVNSMVRKFTGDTPTKTATPSTPAKKAAPAPKPVTKRKSEEPNIFNTDSDSLSEIEDTDETNETNTLDDNSLIDSVDVETEEAEDNDQLTQEIDDTVNAYLDEHPEAKDEEIEAIEEKVEEEVKQKVFINKFVPERSNATMKLIDVSSGKQNKILSQDMDEMASKIIDESDFTGVIKTANPYINRSKFANFDKSYNEKKYRRDIDNAVAALSEGDIKVFIEDVKEEDTSDVFNQKKTLTYTLRDENNHVHTLKFDIPIIIDDCYIFIGGSKKNILKQRIFKPIVKIGPDQIQICTMYNKCTVVRHGRSVDSKTAGLKKFITSNESCKPTYGNAKVKNAHYKTTLDFDYLAKSLTAFKIDNCHYMLDIGELINKLNEFGIDTKKYTNGEAVPIGYKVSGSQKTVIELGDSAADTILNNMSDETRKKVKYSKSGSSQFAYARVKILDKFIPVILFLLFCEGFTEVMKKCDIKYELFDSEKDIKAKYGKDYLVTHGVIYTKDKCILWPKYPYENQLLLNGTNGLPLNEYTLAELDSKDTYIDMLPMFYASANQAQNLDQFKNFLLDPKTVEILKDFNMPTDIVGVFFYSCKLLVNNQYASPNDMVNMRLRGNEIISQIVYQCVVNAYGKYRKTAHRKNPGKINVNPNCVIQALATASLVEDESIMNPIMTLEKTHLVTIKASTSAKGVTLSGINKTDGYTMAKRAYDESMLGVFGITTDHAGNNGIIRCLALEPNITSTNGYIDITPKDQVDDLNEAQLLTPTELLTPNVVRHDDPQRSGMMRGQTTHMVLTDDASPVLIGNRVESIIPYHMHDEFCVTAKQDGKIIDEQNGVYILEYKDGTHDSFDSKPTIKKNASDGMYVEIEMRTDLHVGSTFKKNQVIAGEPRAFTKNEDDIGASMNLGVFAKVGVVSIDDILEDSEPMTKSLSERLGYWAIVKKSKALSADTRIDKIVKIGDHVNIGDTLIAYDSHNGDEEIAKFLAEYSKALKANGMEEKLVESNTTTLKATDSGEVIDIKMYCTVELEELSPSLRKLVGDYYKKIEKSDKFLDKYKNASDNAFYKCGQLRTETASKTEAVYGKIKGEEVGDGVLIEIYIRHKDIIKKGDKTTNYCALKGVVSHVIPEGQEPWSDFRPDEEVSAFISPLSILARKTPSIYTTMFGNKVLVELKRKVIKDYFGE